MSEHKQRVIAINGNMVTVQFDDQVVQNEVAFVCTGDKELKSEIIRVRGNHAEMQVFEDTRGVKVGDPVKFTSKLLSATLGPGLLSQIYDGLQNPLPELAQKTGYFLQRGHYLQALSYDRVWHFTPEAKVGDDVVAGMWLGHVPEGIFRHRIMAPFNLKGSWKLKSIAEAGDYTINHKIATLESSSGELLDVTMVQEWPVKMAIRCYAERLRPSEPLVTKCRIVDTLFPVARGGTYCIPGPFGAGKTVLQQVTSRYADVDVVIIAACGERAGEVVETLREFPELEDPRTGKSLMERTIIICNTSSMPVAAREASVYTGMTLAEYYRQMGLNVLLLADSTSRWAQALREMSGRLEEIPGEEAFPAYLESLIASFYERAGVVRLYNGQIGSLTVGGTVSPAGGNFEEPVTQATLKVVGAFHGLSRDRADARRFPSVHPLESWSKYPNFVGKTEVDYARSILKKGNEVGQMMTVVGEEGTSIADFTTYIKAEFLDAVYLQQNAFDEVDAATPLERQRYVFALIYDILRTEFKFERRDEVRRFFQELTQLFRDWNPSVWESSEFMNIEKQIRQKVGEQKKA